jgi:taurine dioxygenase
MSVVVNAIGCGAAEITGLDCSRPLNRGLDLAVKQAFLDYPVLVVRNQNFAAGHLAEFARQFGRLEGYGGPRPPQSGNGGAKPQLAALRQVGGRETPDCTLYLSPEDPDVLIMSNEGRSDLSAIGIVDNAEIWHSDASHRAEPCQAILLYATRNPSAGGDTEFCDMRAVYEDLSPSLKAEVAGRHAVHHWSKSRNPRFAGTLDLAAHAEGERIARLVPEMHQPVVRTHPESGRHSLYVSPRFTLRICDTEQGRSDALLAEIFALADNPRFHYRHQWREGDLVICDNRCLNHRVRHFPSNEIRSRYRFTVAGSRPFFRLEHEPDNACLERDPGWEPAFGKILPPAGGDRAPAMM